ncbi:MAG: HTH domain-containing protein, partial [Bacteroidetes bacterium]
MTLPALLTQLSRLHDLIRRRATGEVAQCAQRLGVSESTLYRYLSLLRTLGGPIAYSPLDRTYYYTEPVD